MGIYRLILKFFQQDPASHFARLMTGAGIFTLGLTIVMLVGSLFRPSLNQEIIVFLGVVILATGFILALSSFLGIALSRILSHIGPAENRDHPDKSD